MKCTFSEYREQWAVLVIFVAGMVTFLHRNNRRSASADLRKGAIKGSVAERGKLWPVLLAFAALAAAEVTYAATYNLPADLNKGAFLAGSCNTSTYVCPGNVDFGSDNNVVLNVTTSFTLRINGNLVVNNNLCVYDLPGVLTFDVGGNFVANNNTGVSCEFTANITAGGNVSLGNNTSVTGNVNAGGNLSVGSGTIDGYCGYDTTNFTCSNGGCASVTVGIVTTVTCTANGSFKPPAGITLALVEAWGGGGGGGAATGLPDKGGGGAGGQYAYKTTAVTPGTTYSVVVGSGGAGGSASAGSAGGESTFNTNTVVAKGGAGGGYAGTNGGDGAAASGSTTGGIGDTVYRGGNSAAGSSSSFSGNCNDGGAGGGGAGSGGNGGDASGNTAGTGTATGGGSGGSGSNSSGNGAAGSTLGGGGAGACAESATDRTGGTGGAGRVVITYSGTPTPLADWRMDETSWNGAENEVLDSSGNNNHGRARISAGTTALPTTASGSAAYPPSGNGTCNYGQFDTTSGTTRTNTYVELSNMPALPSSFTFAAWIRSTNASQSGQRILVRDDNDNGWGFSLGDPGSNRVRFFNRNVTNSGAVTGDGVDPGCGVFCLDTAAVITSNNWFYVAVTIDTVAKRITHYVFNQSGTLLSNTSSAFAGTWADGNGTAAIGGETKDSPEGIQSSFHFNGNVDEMQIYSGVLSRPTIQTLLTRTRTCPTAGPNHIRVYLDNNTGALTCSPRPVSAIACSDASCTTRFASNVSVTLSPGGTAATIPANGTGTPSVAQVTTGTASVTLGASTPSATGAPTFRCFSGTVATPGTDITGACNVTFGNAGLFVNVPHHRSCDVQTLSITAAKTDDTTKKCVPAFDSGASRDIKLRYSYSNPGSGTLAPTVGSANPPVTALATGSDQTLALTFNAGVATTNFRYQDAGSLSIAASYTGSAGTGDAGLTMATILTDASFINPVVVTPQNFTLSGIPTAPLIAGSPFNVTVTAKNNCSPVATTQNFAGTATLTSSNPLPGAGNATAISQALSVTTGGTASANTTWNEVGTIDLTATTSNYLGSGLSVTGTQAAVGRFQPAYFDTVVTHGCSNAFTYAGLATTPSLAGQPFTVEVKAKRFGADLTDATNTANYAGATWAKAVTLSDAAAGTGTLTNTSLAAASFVSGKASRNDVTYSFPSKLTAPYTLTMRAIDADTPAVSSSGHTEGATPMRSGRLRLSNVFGPVSPLAMPVQAQYWSGSSWVINANDSCTTLTGIFSTAPTGWAWPAATPASTATLNSAIGTLYLSGPNSGTATVTASSVPEWLRSIWGGVANTPPSATANIGIYAPETKKSIHVRELF